MREHGLIGLVSHSRDPRESIVSTRRVATDFSGFTRDLDEIPKNAIDEILAEEIFRREINVRCTVEDSMPRSRVDRGRVKNEIAVFPFV